LELTLIWLPAVGIIYTVPSDGFVKNLRVEIFAKQKYYPVLDKSKLCAHQGRSPWTPFGIQKGISG